MPNLVVCCDGTWNTPDEQKDGVPTPTNVAKLRNALIEDASQHVYYHSGVGTGKGWWDHIVGGGAGEGLDGNTMSAYSWLAKTYQPGDRIYLFGFSRGAYTARCCGGLIAKYGLLDLSNVDAAEAYKRIGELFDFHRDEHHDRSQAFPNPNGYAFYNQKEGQSQANTTLIFFIGVWDTVGALGIPDDFAILGLLDNAARYRFYDTTLTNIVAHARHAVAIDERRASFAPTLWTDTPGVDCKQIYFPGVHSDVGGGYPETGLSDGALQWMIEEAGATGLRFREGIEDRLKPDALGVLHDSCTGIFDFLKSRPRSIPFLETGDTTLLHASTLARLATPLLDHGPYWAARKPETGASSEVAIYARERWNWTGLYLEAGVTYGFSATGQWVDGTEAFGPDGGTDRFHGRDVLHLASDLLGRLEPLYKKLGGEQNADFWLTLRVQTSKWFTLIGFVANDVMPDNPKPNDLPTGQTFEIGAGGRFTPKNGGYLYCFANDTWQTYGNNRGSVSLTVSRD